MVNYVVVFVPDVVLAVQYGHRVHELVTDIIRIHPGMPEIGDASKEDHILHQREDCFEEA